MRSKAKDQLPSEYQSQDRATKLLHCIMSVIALMHVTTSFPRAKWIRKVSKFIRPKDSFVSVKPMARLSWKDNSVIIYMK